MKKLASKTALTFFMVIISIIIMSCAGTVSLSNLSSAELFKLGKERYESKKYFKAVEVFQTIVYNYRGESIVDTAQYFLALSYFGAKEYELAQVEFNRLVLNYPSSSYFKHAIFMKAVSFFEATPSHYGLDQSDLVVAIKQFEDYIIDYPESELITDVNKYLLIARTRMAKKYYMNGVVYKRMGAYQAAIKYFQKVVDDYTDTKYASMATFGIAEMEYKQKNYDKAEKKFKDFIVVFHENKLTVKAKKLAMEAAFKQGEKEFKNGAFSSAKEKFEAFIKEYPEHKKSKKADKYLKKIKEYLLTNAKDENVNS